MNCSPNTPNLTEEDISERMSGLDRWSRGERWIEKTYQFKSFLRAMSFVNAVAYVAEAIHHHPDIVIQYNDVTLRNWTHVTGGVTEYDFLLAKRIDALVESRKA